MQRFSWWLVLAVSSVSMVGSPVRAQDRQDKTPDKVLDKPAAKDKEQEKTDEAARVLFDVGAKAYAAGLYVEAVAAFRESHALAPDRPTVLFSLAQAERRQYTVKPEPLMLEAAIAHFRKYLEIVPEGGRRGDVVVALGELEALRAGNEAPTKKAARIFITTETPWAVIYIDGQKRAQIPVIEEAPPGNHVIKIEAPGFVSETREILAVEGTIFPIEINLREQPSFLALKAPPGATIIIDGRAYGDAPLQRPLEVPSGAHQLAVTQRGYVSFDEHISVTRAATTSVNVTLRPTVQRRASFVLFGGAIVALGAGTALTIAAFAKDAEAAEIYAKAKKENIDSTMLQRYADARNDRDILSGTAVSTILFAFGVGVGAGATYWFDSSANASGRKDARISLTPLAGGGFVSVGLGF